MMKTLILASGKGERLRALSKGGVKPLISLLGLTLIERIILTARHLGLNDFLIVVGYQAEKIKKFLGNGSRYKVRISYIYNENWQRGNGISLLKAQNKIKEPFILLMSDHIFAPEILENLLKQNLNPDEGILCIDKNLKRIASLKEATKVKLKNNEIIEDIGKNLEEFQAVDCGIFYLTPAVFKALESSIQNGDDSLSAGIRVMAKNGKMRGLDIGDYHWIDIDTPQDYKKAEKMLLKSLTKLTDGPVARYLNRPISIRISKFLVNYPFTPNMITLFSFLFSLISAFFFTLQDYIFVLIAGIFAQFSSILDGCDGEVAKLKHRVSDYGAWFDAILDRYADILIILGIVWGYWKLSLDFRIWLIGFWAAVGSLMNSYTAIKHDAIFKKQGKKPIFRMGRDVRFFIIFLSAIINKLYSGLLFLALLTNITSLLRLYRRWQI